MGVTRDDVARLAGVSPATVSYVVNNGPRPVSAAARARVLAAIEELGYSPHAIARSLKTQRTESAGIIIADMLNPYLASVAQAAHDELLQQGYSLLVANSSESPARELMWLKFMRSRRVDGLILEPTGDNLPFLKRLAGPGHPPQLVLIDRAIPELEADTVLLDNVGGARAAVRHLIDLGHRRIALLGLPHEMSPGGERLEGYKLALRAAGLPIDAALIFEGTFVADEASEMVSRLLNVRPAPTAVFASSNRLARGVLQQIKVRRLRMPDDIALAVFDDVDYFEWMTPSITAVEVSGVALGQQAVDYLHDRLTGAYGGPPRLLRIPYRLHVRESTLGMGESAV